MCVSRSKFVAVFLMCFVPLFGLVFAPQVQASLIVPGSITEVNPSGYDTYVEWDASRDIGDPYWHDRSELIDSQGNITDAMTGKTMLGLEGLLLNNNAKGTKGNGPGDDYELSFQIDPNLVGSLARVYVMIGIRDAFAADPDDWLENRLNDNSYSPQMNVDRNHGDRTWIGLDAYGVPIGSTFNRVLRRPAPDGRPMAFPCRDGVGEEYFAFYHDYGAGETVNIYGCYSSGSNYFVFVEPVPLPAPSIWTSVDIGNTKTGDAVYDADGATWDIYADGGDIWGGADAFHYVYTENSGDFLIQGRIESLVRSSDWAKAGFMVRQSTDANSAHASFFTRGADDYLGIQYRPSAGSGSGEAVTRWGGPVMPIWFRFQRVGGTMTAYTSDNAIDWAGFGSIDVGSGDVLVGMAVTSHDSNRITAARFRNVYVTNKGQVFAHAGLDQSVDQGTADARFVLDGTNSLDADEYLWEQISPATPTFDYIAAQRLPELQAAVDDALAALAAAQTALADAEAALVDAEDDLDFAHILFDMEAISQETLDKFQAAYDSAVATRDAAQAAVDDAQAALDQAQADLAAYTPDRVAVDWTQPLINLDAADVDIHGDTTFTFRLTCTNTASGATQTSTVDIFVRDKEQVNAGADLDLWDWEGDRVDLDATASTGDIARWEWRQIGGPSVPSGIFGANTATPFFWVDDYDGDTTLTFELTMTAVDGGVHTDQVTVVVHDEQHAIANAGADQEGWEMRDFTLDASGSTTRDGAPSTDLTYHWEQVGGPAVYKFQGVDTANPTFIAPEIPLTKWPPYRTLTFRVTATAPNGSTSQDDVNVTAKDAEFENVFYREHEDFDFHNSLVNGKWYPEEAEYGVHYCWGAVGNEVYGTVGRLDPSADYWWNNWGGWHDYRDGVSLGTGGQVRDTSGTDWKSGWINPGAGDFWKYTFDLPTGSDHAYIVNWMATDNSWHGNARAYYDYELGNTSPVGYFRICRRGWDNYAPLISPPFAVNAGIHKIMLDAYGGGEPNYARFELHVPMSDKNIADAGPDKGAVAGELVTLDARASQAIDTAYSWEQLSPDSPAVALTDVGNGVATFTAPAVADPTDFVFRLTVSGASNDSVDFVHVMVVPSDTVYALFADQRTAQDNTAVDWGNRDVGGAVWGSDYEAGNWGAIAPGPTLSSDVVVHHNTHGGDINLDCWSEFKFTLPTGSAGDYYFYMRAAYKNGDSAYIRYNEGVIGIWPTDTPDNNHHRIANDNGYRGQMDWNWARVQADTVTLQDGDNEVRIYGRESHCNEGRPFMWDAMIFSKSPLNRGDFDFMDRVALAGQIPVALVADAGPDFDVYSGATGVLDGTGSMGAITTGTWAQTGGPSVGTITMVSPLVATFVAPPVAEPQVCTFELTVGDGTNTASDSVDVTILAAAAAPAMPTNLTAEGVERGILLDWDGVPGAASYKILRRESWKWWPFDTLVAEGLSDTSYIDRSMSVYMDELYDYTVIAVNEFGESIPAYPVYKVYALSSNLALRPDAGPFAKKPHPGWNLDQVMNNRVREESFDSWYNSQPSADDYWGYWWSQPLYFQEIHYYPGNVFGDGGWWTSLGVQFTKDGVSWYDIPNNLITITPPYDFTDSPDGRSPGLGQLPYVRRHIISFPRVEGIALRIYGAPGGSNDFTSMGELEVYGVPGPEGYLYSFAGADFSADENTTATLDGTDSSTPVAVKYHWEQVTGAGGQVTQVDMTSAFNADVIYDAGEDPMTQDPFDPGGPWVYTSDPSVGAEVLPADGKVGGYQLGPYTDKNCLLLSGAQQTGVIPVTPGNYGYAGIAFAAANGSHWGNLILNYANGDSPPIPFEIGDWFFRADLDRVVEETWRLSLTGAERNDQEPPDVGGPNIYQRVVPVDSTRTLVSMTFTGYGLSGNQTAGIFAVNLGPEVPILQLSDPDSGVCTFQVPEITHDQVVTFRLTVWDADNNSATDDVDVTLVDTNEGRSNAGPDVIDVLPFRNATLDGSGTAGDIIWYRWEQIGGPPAVTLWNADQAQATIIAPQSGTLMFNLTVGAANGTVSKDTMIVTVNSPIGNVPAGGFLQDVLLLGANYYSRFNETDINHDYLDGVGGEANQNPSAGETVSTGYNQSEDPLVWTRMHRDDGWWFADWLGCPYDNFIGYLHVYIISPQQRDARCWFWHDDEMRCFNNGALSFYRDGWDGNQERYQDFTLYEGINSMTFKLHEGGGGNRLTIRFTDRSNNQYSDLQYALSYSDLFPVAVLEQDPFEALVVGAGELMFLDGRLSAAGATYSWEQVWPQEPEFSWWFDDSNTPILGAPMVDEDTDFWMRLWVDTGTDVGADVVKVTVATKEVPGPITGLSGEWAGDVGAVLRWNAAEHASSYNILRAESPVGPYETVGTADTNMYVDVGPLSRTVTYYYRVEPANILNVGPVSGPITVAWNPKTNVARSDLVLPIVGQPNPQGGGSRDIGIMNDGIVAGQNYDTYDGNTPNPGSLQGEDTFEFFGYLFDRSVTIHSLVYYTGGVFGDGGWWTSIGVQTTKDGVTWQDASGVVFGPIYDTTDSPSGRSWNEKYIISIVPDTVTGVRIAGYAGGSMRFVSIAELEAYGDIGGLEVNAGADQAVDELSSVTLDGSATLGATDYLWTQVSGPSVVITNPTQQSTSFTAPAVVLQDSVTFRLTASNAQWSAWDEVTFTVTDVDTYHIYRYSADFDGRSAVGSLQFADGTWVQGYAVDTCTRYMEGMPANRAASEDAVAGNDLYFQNTGRTQTYRDVSLDPFDVRYRDFGLCGAEPFIGYTTQGDWWNYTFGSTKTFNASVPADGVMYVSVLAATGYGHMTAEVLLDEVPVTTIGFAGGDWGAFAWHPGTDSFLVSKGKHTIRIHLTENGWDFCKFRFDVAVPAIEQVLPTDGKVTIKWNDVGRTYTLEQADGPAGPWTNLYGPTSETSWTSDVLTEGIKFYRVKVE